MPKNQAISGYFITFSPAEEKDLLNYLVDNGLTADKEGIKALILSQVYPEKGYRPEMEDLFMAGIGALGKLFRKKM